MKLLSGICSLLVCAVAGTLHAESIGVNFVGKEAKTQTLKATQSAGVASVAQDHWNNMTISEDDGNGHDNSGNLAKVNDNAGKEVKGASVAVAATAETQVWPNNGASWGFTGTNLILQSGILSPSPTITVKGIPYKNYAVYVYLAAGDNGGQGSATISVANKVAGKVDGTPTCFCNFNWQGGNYVKSEAKTLKEAKDSKGANYIVFTGNSASDMTVEFNGTLGGGWIGVAAIQIVQTPEGK